jgi:hypothetical protein
MRITPGALALLAVCILLPAGSSVTHGQVVRGTVADSATSVLLPGCWAALLNRDGQVVDRVLTDSAGQFVLTAPRAGDHTVRFERLGYRTIRSEPFALDPRSEISLSVFLPPGAVGLAPVTVTAAPEAATRHLSKAGYFERKRTGHGYYLDGPELERRREKAPEFADVLEAIPGVSAMAAASGFSPTVRAFRLRGMDSMMRACQLPLVYLDGVRVVDNEQGEWAALIRDLNAVLTPEDLLAIEVYRGPSEVPSAYGGADSGCGVILIWTRR